MAHPKREKYIPYLFKKLGYECPIAWDQISDRWDTGKRAWLLHDPAASHHLVLQDDVLLSENLPAALEKLVRVISEQPISLFAHNKKRWNPLIAKCQEHPFTVRWLLLKRLNWGPAIMLPTAHIQPMIEWVERNCFMPNYDARIGYYYMAHSIPVWYTMPSLVDHRTDGESLVWEKKEQNGRQAKFFIGEYESGINLDWKKGAVCESTSMEKYFKEHMVVNETWRLKNGENEEFDKSWRLKKVGL